MAHPFPMLARLLVVTRFLLGLAVGVCAFAQAPTVGEIEFYGLRSLSQERILAAIKLKSGDPIPPSKGDLQDKIADLPGVVLARVEAVCCQGRDVILFIGIEERGAPHPSFRTAPAGDAVLAEELVASYRLFLQAVQRAASRGAAGEDLTAGHSLMEDPQARAYQERFVTLATERLEELRAVLRGSPDADQRAIAAALIGYATAKQEVVNDLQAAVQDPDEAVRVNAVRSLNAFAVSGMKIAPTWFLELLHSVVLSDRVEAVRALLTLTDRGAPDVVELVRARGLAPLAEMARWKSARYAVPPFLLLGRIAGISDVDVHQRWQKGDRETVIQKAIGAPARKRPALQ
jgi:hypothetical protein